MSYLEDLLTECKEAYYKGWNDESIEECKLMLNTLTHQELLELRNSRWMSERSPLFQDLFSLLHEEQIAQIVTKLKTLSNAELFKEYKTTQNDIVRKKVPFVLKDRYDTMSSNEQLAFLDIKYREESPY